MTRRELSAPSGRARRCAGLQRCEARRGARGSCPSSRCRSRCPGAIRSIVGAGKPNLNVRGSERISFSGTSRWYPGPAGHGVPAQAVEVPAARHEAGAEPAAHRATSATRSPSTSTSRARPRPRSSNRIKIHYKGYEDEILQKVDLGNTSLSLPGTQYVSYGGQPSGPLRHQRAGPARRRRDQRDPEQAGREERHPLADRAARRSGPSRSTTGSTSRGSSSS